MRTQALDLSVDLLRVLLWQYNDAARLQALLQKKQDWYNAAQSGFWQDWIADVFDLRTANDFGLAVWAVLLNVKLVTGSQVDPPGKPLFGFATDSENFTNGNFSSSSAVVLTTAQKRTLLRLRYFQLVTRGAAPEVNDFLTLIFGPGVYVNDSNKMAIAYVFPPGVLTSAVELLLTSYDVLPRPAGVQSKIVVQGEADGWGFGRYHENFSNGNFFVGP